MEISVSQQLTDLWKMAVALEIQAAEEARRAHLAFKKEQNGKLPEMWSRFSLANSNHKRIKQLMLAFEYETQRKKNPQWQKKQTVAHGLWSVQETQRLLRCGRETNINVDPLPFYGALYAAFKPTHRTFESVRSKARRLDIYPWVLKQKRKN